MSPQQKLIHDLASRPNGVTSDDPATGHLEGKKVRNITSNLKLAGRLYVLRTAHREARYFATAEGMAAFMERTGAVQYVKPVAQPADPVKPRDVSYFEPSQKLDKAAKVVTPPGVKRTVAAPFVDMRYAVAPGFRGEFSREWSEKRGAAC